MQPANHYIFLIIAAVACAAAHDDRKLTQFKSEDGGPGQPLLLTPLLINASLTKREIQSLARVEGPQFLGVESYSGYLTVDEEYNSNLFFWYFPAEENAKQAPVVLWLQGGPGSSSLIGLFLENGPLKVVSADKLQKRKYSWSRTHNVIYIDSPVGTGFSYTDHEDGYARNDCDVGRNLHLAIIQLYELFGWSNCSDFWITGESYAGKFVPALAYHIHKAQQAGAMPGQIPLKGVAIGNGLSDPVHQLKYGDYFYQLGLIDDNGLDKFHATEAATVDCINKDDMDCAFDLFDTLILGNTPNGSIYKNLTGYDWYYNFLQANDEDFLSNMAKFLQTDATRRALHVGNKPFHNMDKVNKVKMFLKQDYMKSVAPWIEELLKHYTVCIYSGQLDVIIPFPSTRNFLKHLKFPGSDRYKVAPNKIWRVDGELAGYVKQAGNLIEILVRNAGHLAPADQPKWVFEMINHLTHHKH